MLLYVQLKHFLKFFVCQVVGKRAKHAGWVEFCVCHSNGCKNVLQGEHVLLSF